MTTLQEKLNTHVNKIEKSKNTVIDVNKLSATATFVIPVFNSEESIQACVESITKLERRDLINEVILINDGSNDQSLTTINELQNTYAPTLGIIIIDNGKRRYAAYTRNRGIEAATGDLVCFIDSDIILPSNYLVSHIDQHERSACITFSLRKDITMSSIDSIEFPISTTQEFRSKIIAENDLNDARFQFDSRHSLAELCLTCAVTYKREDLLQVEGCPEAFVGWGFNDTAMAAKVIALGRNVIPVTECTTYHITHPPRSGTSETKWREYELNAERYARMLELPMESTWHYEIDELKIEDMIAV